MKLLCYKPALNDRDALAVAYYLTLQDRIEEALDWFGRVDRQAVPEQLQCDYLRRISRSTEGTSTGRGHWRKRAPRKA